VKKVLKYDIFPNFFLVLGFYGAIALLLIIVFIISEILSGVIKARGLPS
jgi:uncharacterized membrane protein YkvA (DUF1232 family)